MKTKMKVTGIAQMNLEFDEETTTTKLLTCDIILKPDKRMDYYAYHTNEEILNEDGCQAIALAFVSGLACSILFAENKGYRSKAEYLEYVIDQLKRQLDANPRVSIAKVE